MFHTWWGSALSFADLAKGRQSAINEWTENARRDCVTRESARPAVQVEGLHISLDIEKG